MAEMNFLLLVFSPLGSTFRLLYTSLLSSSFFCDVSAAILISS